MGDAKTPSWQPVPRWGTVFSLAELVDGAKVYNEKLEVVNSCMCTAAIVVHCGFSPVNLAKGGNC
jgi:hypothetical protein